MKTFRWLLHELGDCDDVIEWAGDMSIEQFVKECPRGDWLLWLAYKVGVEERMRILTNGHCANTVRHLMRDERSIKAVDMAIAHGQGNITRDEFEKSRLEACAVVADDASAAAVSGDVAFFAACAYATAARKDAWAAADTNSHKVSDYESVFEAWDAVINDAHNAAIREATDVVGANARIENQMQTADICRKYIGDLIIEKVNEQLKTAPEVAINNNTTLS